MLRIWLWHIFIIIVWCKKNTYYDFIYYYYDLFVIIVNGSIKTIVLPWLFYTQVIGFYCIFYANI